MIQVSWVQFHEAVLHQQDSPSPQDARNPQHFRRHHPARPWDQPSYGRERQGGSFQADGGQQGACLCSSGADSWGSSATADQMLGNTRALHRGTRLTG